MNPLRPRPYRLVDSRPNDHAIGVGTDEREALRVLPIRYTDDLNCPPGLQVIVPPWTDQDRIAIGRHIYCVLNERILT